VSRTKELKRRYRAKRELSRQFWKLSLVRASGSSFSAISPFERIIGERERAYLRGQYAAVGERDVHVHGARHHVRVGDDHARLPVQHKPAALPLRYIHSRVPAHTFQREMG